MRITPEWGTVLLGDHVDILSGHPFKSNGFTDDEADLPLVKGENLQQRYIDWGKAKRWPRKDLASLQKYQLQVEDVVLAMDRPWVPAGLKFAWIKPSDPTSLLVQRVCRLRVLPTMEQRFLRCLIGSPQFEGYLKPMVTGINVPHISAKQITGFRFPLPPLPTQRRIASILSAYDDLIENNTRRIAILEEMARRIYEEWFVHFRFPGHEGVKLVETQLGMVPEGWRIGRLDDLMVLQRGFDLPTSARHPGPFPVYAASGQHGWHETSKVKGPGVITGRSGSLGVVTYAPSDFWPLNTTLWVKDFKLGSPVYCFYVLSAMDLEAFNSGAAVPTLNRNDIHGLPTLLPADQALTAFDALVLPMVNLKTTLLSANANLRTQRDLLLPKLISGEIDVSELPEADVLKAAE
jgi:type I restriction enzyme S subunit